GRRARLHHYRARRRAHDSARTARTRRGTVGAVEPGARTASSRGETARTLRPAVETAPEIAMESQQSDRFILGPATLALGDGTSKIGRIAVERGRIREILEPDGRTDFPLPPKTHVAPGMIDVHTNGARDFLFNRDQGYAVPVASEEYARQGATGFVAS